MITIDKIKIGLKEAIEKSGKTQKEIAEKLSVTQSCIAHYVKGDIVPALDTFANLCKVLDVSADDILCIND
ncbi:helix-turn-helix domain-containing protein [Pumilibacter intestinalis]|uniref:helix-turn-helix domain-containing protein n=1 Tax=Pumilibacter intestinalis TaxID=2941511 RepID=UPI00203AF683|nr:helix-turn-helix transcriptional regulator [Pumilibacter intestinalis]